MCTRTRTFAGTNQHMRMKTQEWTSGERERKERETVEREREGGGGGGGRAREGDLGEPGVSEAGPRAGGWRRRAGQGRSSGSRGPLGAAT